MRPTAKSSNWARSASQVCTSSVLKLFPDWAPTLARSARARRRAAPSGEGPLSQKPGAPGGGARRGRGTIKFGSPRGHFSQLGGPAPAPTMDAMAAAASKMKNEATSASTPPKKKSTRVAEAIRAWQRCPKAWRAKLVEGGEPGTSEVEKLKRAEKRKGT